jgi:hypothetical protein
MAGNGAPSVEPTGPDLPLHDAAAEGDLSRVIALMDAGANIQAVAEYKLVDNYTYVGVTPLACAVAVSFSSSLFFPHSHQI